MKRTFVLIGLGLMLGISVKAETSMAGYQAVVASQHPTAYFKLDGSLESAVDSSVVLEFFAGGYATDAFRTALRAWAYTDQNTSFLRYLSASLVSGGGQASSNATAKGSVTFLFRSLSGQNVGGQRTLFDATTTAGMGTTNHNAFMLYFENDTATDNPNALKLRFGDVTTTVLPYSNVLASTWYYFAITYDEARVPNKAIWYVGPAGRELVSGMTTNAGDAVAGEANGLYIGQRADIKGAYRSPGKGRIDEFAIWNRELSSTEISNQFAKLPQLPLTGATYQEVVQAQLPQYYFKLDNTLAESVQNGFSLTAQGDGGSFTTDAFGNPNGAYSFSKTNDALYSTLDLVNGGGVAPDTTAAGVGTISFLFRMLESTNTTGQRFIFSAPGSEMVDTDDNQLALFLESATSTNPYPSGLKLRVGNQTKGHSSSDITNTIPIATAEQLVPNAWYYFALTYDESRNTPECYTYFGRVGGTLTNSYVNPANASVVGDNGWFVIGNKREGSIITDNAFRGPGDGAIDEFAIWNEELSPAEIQAQFAATVPQVSPALGIALRDGKVILSWSATGTAGYQLVSAPSLTATVWDPAGAATLVSGVNYVTNDVAGGPQFYRLRK